MNLCRAKKLHDFVSLGCKLNFRIWKRNRLSGLNCLDRKHYFRTKLLYAWDWFSSQRFKNRIKKFEKLIFPQIYFYINVKTDFRTFLSSSHILNFSWCEIRVEKKKTSKNKNLTREMCFSQENSFHIHNKAKNSQTCSIDSQSNTFYVLLFLRIEKENVKREESYRFFKWQD